MGLNGKPYKEKNANFLKVASFFSLLRKILGVKITSLKVSQKSQPFILLQYKALYFFF